MRIDIPAVPPVTQMPQDEAQLSSGARFNAVRVNASDLWMLHHVFVLAIESGWKADIVLIIPRDQWPPSFSYAPI
jgi:hypothetical protein